MRAWNTMRGMHTSAGHIQFNIATSQTTSQDWTLWLRNCKTLPKNWRRRPSSQSLQQLAVDHAVISMRVHL